MCQINITDEDEDKDFEYEQGPNKIWLWSIMYVVTVYHPAIHLSDL